MRLTSRCRRLRGHVEGEDGFTLVEMIIAMTLMAMSLLALAQMLFSSMGALNAAGQRSSSVELVNKEMERIRSLPYDSVCVTSADVGAAYVGSPPMFEARPAVIGTTCDFDPEDTVPASANMTQYTIRRWVTWTDAAGSTGATVDRELKRLTVEIDWQENSKTPRTLRLTSVLYPGGVGNGDPLNAVPFASAATTPTPATVTLTTPGTPITFDATASSDLDGDPLTYEWIFGDGSTSTAPTTSHTYTAAGNYDVVLKVSDGQGGTGQTVVPVSVGTADGNFSPTASFSVLGPASGVAPLTVEFDGSASSDPNGDPLSYTWDWGDGSQTVGPQAASHVFTSAGTFTVSLRVEDPAGGWSMATTTVSTTPLNCAVNEGYFQNPTGNATRNDIVVDKSDQPVSSSITFTAKTNSACSTLRAELPTSKGGVLSVPMTATESGGVKTWTATTSISSYKFHVGTDQTGYFRGSDGTVSIDRPVYFTVHR